jgi:hypothetical protein
MIKKIIKYFKLYCEVTGILYPVGMMFLFTDTFMLAYNSGVYKCLVDINKYGEADFEIIMVMLLTPIALYGAYLDVKLIVEDFERRHEV